MNSNRSSESVGFVSKRANNALKGVNNKNKQEPNTEEEVESYVKDAKKCNGSLIDSSLNEKISEGTVASLHTWNFYLFELLQLFIFCMPPPT